MGIIGTATGANNAWNAAKGVGGAVKAVGRALGIGVPSEAERRHRAYAGYHRIIRSGDLAALRQGIRQAKYAGGKWEMAWALANNSTDANAAEAARQAAGQPRAGLDLVVPLPTEPTGTTQYYGDTEVMTWPDDGVGTVPIAGSASSGRTKGKSISRAPAAPKSAPLGLTSPLDTPSTTTSRRRLTTAPKAKRPCKYGPRDENGYCPKKPAAQAGRSRPGRAPKESRAHRLARTRAEKAVEAGLLKAGKAGIAAAGGGYAAAGLLAQGALLVGAGVAAYYITTKLMQLHYRTYDDLRYEAANAYRESRRAAAESLGRPLNAEELRQLALWFKQRKAYLDALEANGTPLSDVSSLTFEQN
jgi:hypothetical protein